MPLTSTERKTKVTVVQKDPIELQRFRVSPCWPNDSSCHAENVENLPKTRPVRTSQPKRTPRNIDLRLSGTGSFKRDLFQQEFQSSNSDSCKAEEDQSATKLHNLNARYIYGQRLRAEAEERDRRQQKRRQQIAMQAQLEQITAQLESAKRVQENLLKTFGMSHNAARYIRRQDEDFARLKKKVDQFSEIRSKELSKRIQQMKRFQDNQQIELKKANEKDVRLRDFSHPAHRRQTLSSTLNNSISSSSPNTNTASPSSTISISSCCSSPMSGDEPNFSKHFIKSSRAETFAKATPPTSNLLSSSTPYERRSPGTLFQKPPDFTFYKQDPLKTGDTIEVTDIDFFEKVEDETMIEVNELLNKMQSVLRDLDQELE